MEIEKRLHNLQERLTYIQDICGGKPNSNVDLLSSKLQEYLAAQGKLPPHERIKRVNALEDLYTFLENKLDRDLSPMDKVRIVRHPQRICLKDILENVYDNYSEIGGRDEYSIDPGMLIARAYITRRVGGKVYHQPVMVIGQEKGHGQEFRNGGSVKPWGNAKALHYMKVAEVENIPIHTYIFTPGSYPIEDYPGAAQQIARNLYEMAGLKAPIIAVTSEGGSGGAEAVGLADTRLMMSHGYYSVISPEGAAAIESGIRQGQRVSPEVIEQCAENLKMTALDNKVMGYIDEVIPEPPMGARPGHYDFFRTLRREVVQATDSVVLEVKGWKFFRAMVLRGRRAKGGGGADDVYVRWSLSSSAKERLVWRRYSKYRGLSHDAYIDKEPTLQRYWTFVRDLAWSVISFFKYDVLKKHTKHVAELFEELWAESMVLLGKLSHMVRRIGKAVGADRMLEEPKGDEKSLTELSDWKEETNGVAPADAYVSPLAKFDKAVTCPKAKENGCLDIWAPDLYNDFAGVCPYCGYHFRMEYQWYLNNIFDGGSIVEFNEEVESANPLSYPGLDDKLKKAKEKTNLRCACTTFEAKIQDMGVVVAMLAGSFRGGSVGAAEGEKFIRAAERARKKHYPFLAYVHGTAGIRIQEGTNGVIQMPRCTMAVRRYLEAGGLYVVLYDTNSYAGPVASFLGCSPYQFAVRSANIGFAGPGVIKETTGMDIPPDYHNAKQALSRGHIQGIWDRRKIRFNLHQALMLMGGRNLYYR